MVLHGCPTADFGRAPKTPNACNGAMHGPETNSARLGLTRRARLSWCELATVGVEAAKIALIPIEWVTLYGQDLSISVAIFLVV